MELSRGLYIDIHGDLISVLEWDDEINAVIVTGVKKLQNILMLEEV